MRIFGKSLRCFTATHLFPDDKGEPAVATPPSEEDTPTPVRLSSGRSCFFFLFFLKLFVWTLGVLMLL